MHRTLTILLLALAATTGTARGGAVLDPHESPPWRVSEWINGDPGPIGGHKGRVLVIHFFQMWCPASNHVSIPALQRWDGLWGDRDDYLGVSIHSVFEGHPFQTPELLRAFVREKGMRHPVGIDAYEGGDDLVPVTMKYFHARGTPHLAIIDKEGFLVFSHFGVFDVPTVEAFIDRLLKQETDYKTSPKPTRTDSLLSGAYELRLEQTARSCGPLEPPREMAIRLEVHKNSIDADFPSRYMDLNGLSLDYDSQQFQFEGVLEHRAEVRGDPVEAEARIRGSFVRGSAPPALEYELMFRTRSENPASNCDIRAKGTAVRTGN